MSDLENELRAEREIISRATAGPWIAEWHGDDWWYSIYGAAAGEEVLPEVATLDDRESKADAKFIAHARAALPLRNAQVEAVLDKCASLNAMAQAQEDNDDWAHGINMAARIIRRAIEEAGA